MAFAWANLSLLGGALFGMLGMLARNGSRFDAVNARIAALTHEIIELRRDVTAQLNALRGIVEDHLAHHAG